MFLKTGQKKEKWTEMRHASNILLCRSSTASEAVGLARSTYHNLSIVLFGRGNVFTPVCQSFCSQGVSASLHTGIHTPSRQTTPSPPSLGRPPTLWILQDMANKRAVRILLKCRLVSSSCQSEDKLGYHLINHHEKQTLLLKIVKLNRQLCFIGCFSSNQFVHLPQGQRRSTGQSLLAADYFLGHAIRITFTSADI